MMELLQRKLSRNMVDVDGNSKLTNPGYPNGLRMLRFHETAGERAKEIDVPQRTLSRKADEFERDGMASLFSSGEQGGARATRNSLPPEMRQLIVDLHAEHPGMSWREIAEICYIRYGRRPAHHSVKHLATAGLPPSLQVRRYQPWH
jgi:putative transposase